MHRPRRKMEPPAGVAASPSALQRTKPPRANRLSRSFRQSQAAPAELDSPRNQRAPDFKTPSRIHRSKLAAASCGESPHNDSDFQHDIIWDATSPSPHKLGKRGKKKPTRVVNISEIVSRIAPEHGRPLAAEPTLQQWIGDSANIPCTPDLQAPRVKKKSPRLNSVDDLLRLAKQFDLNVVHHDEEDTHQQSLDLLSEDILDFRDDLRDKVSSSHLENHQPPVSPASATDMQPHLDQQLEDDLDFLFDGMTQQVSGNLSQALSQTEPASSENCGKSGECSRGSSSAVCKMNIQAANEFEDDWDDDDLLNDSLVLEMTQNPLNFPTPKRCSTQKPGGQVNQRETAAAVCTAVPVTSSARTRVEKENVTPRVTFKLQSNSGSSTRVQMDTRADQLAKCGTKDGWQSRLSADTGPHLTEPQRSQIDVKNSAGNLGTTGTFGPGVIEFMDDDLDSLFLSDPVWDDLADDNLLCEMCEDLENQILSLNNKQTPALSNQRSALQSTHKTSQNWIQTSCSDSSGLSGVSTTVTQVKQPFRSLQVCSPSGPQPANDQHFSFKKPSNLVTMATEKVKCSSVEIELKKQQAMERRRQRLQAVQNRPGKT